MHNLRVLPPNASSEQIPEMLQACSATASNWRSVAKKRNKTSLGRVIVWLRLRLLQFRSAIFDR
jgi:hypothetical protein